MASRWASFLALFSVGIGLWWLQEFLHPKVIAVACVLDEAQTATGSCQYQPQCTTETFLRSLLLPPLLPPATHPTAPCMLDAGGPRADGRMGSSHAQAGNECNPV
jgi:hypothetical protein